MLSHTASEILMLGDLECAFMDVRRIKNFFFSQSDPRRTVELTIDVNSLVQVVS